MESEVIRVTPIDQCQMKVFLKKNFTIYLLRAVLDITYAQSMVERGNGM